MPLAYDKSGSPRVVFLRIAEDRAVILLIMPHCYDFQLFTVFQAWLQLELKMMSS